MKSLNTIQKIANVLKILTYIAFILCIIGAVGLVAGGITLFSVPFLPENIVELIISESGVENMTTIAVSMIIQSDYIALMTIPTFLTYRYLKNELQDGTPFTHRGSKEILKVGIIRCVLPLAAYVVCEIIGAIAGVKNEFSNEFDITIGLVMIFLSFVFSYGADLVEEKKENTENTDL